MQERPVFVADVFDAPTNTGFSSKIIHKDEIGISRVQFGTYGVYGMLHFSYFRVKFKGTVNYIFHTMGGILKSPYPMKK